MAAINSIDEGQLQGICRVLGETNGGMTGSEIGNQLNLSNIADPLPTQTKWKRLFAALLARQRADGCANNVLAFIRRVMNPALFHADAVAYDAFRDRLNVPLAFSGLQVNERGELVPVTAARTISEAEQRRADSKPNCAAATCIPTF